MSRGSAGGRGDQGALGGRTVSRRAVLRWSGAAGMLGVSAAFTQACTPVVASDADANGLVLPDGFTSRVVARGGERVGPSGLVYRIFPDGAATFADPHEPGGWYLVVNHEIPGVGGVTSIRFAPDGTVVDARAVLSGTGMNCAGGATPWGTWLSCEEFDWGHVWECDPTGERAAVRHRAMGAFAHEAAAVASDGRVYLTEDRRDGGFYRFTPDRPGELSSGLLEVAVGDGAPGVVDWAEVPDPDPGMLDTACRRQVPDTVRFDGGEGIDTDGGRVWFTTKGDDRVWQYELSTREVSLRYQGGGSSILSGVDNLYHDDASGALLIAEDGGDMELVMLSPDNTASVVVHLPGQEHSEVTGPCFSPDGQRLYFSSQRGPAGGPGTLTGVTYEVTGPFDELLGRT